MYTFLYTRRGGPYPIIKTNLEGRVTSFAYGKTDGQLSQMYANVYIEIYRSCVHM